MNDLQIMNVCGVDCYEKDGVAYLKLENVAKGLGFSQEKNGKEYVKWERVASYLHDLGFSPLVGKDTFIPENIFYRLAMKAKNEVAERFQAKVADEIIPSIRKHGGYIAGQESLSDDELLERAVLVAKRKIAERDRIIEEQKRKIEEDKPKTIFADAVVASDGSILVRELAKILRQNGADYGEKRLYKRLRADGFICQNSTEPTQRAMEMGLFERLIRTVQRGNALPRETVTTKVTAKGQMYFINKYIGA